MNHGHVTPNPDGSRARCGGPGLCDVCSNEAAALTAKKLSERPVNAKKPSEQYEKAPPPVTAEATRDAITAVFKQMGFVKGYGVFESEKGTCFVLEFGTSIPERAGFMYMLKKTIDVGIISMLTGKDDEKEEKK